jgi:hypothetical protein
MENTSNILTVKEVALAKPALFVRMSNEHWATRTPLPQRQALSSRLEPPVLNTLCAGSEHLEEV